MIKRGIILLCIGEPVYKLWAHNMIVSIRANSTLPVYVVGDYPAKDWHTLPDKVIPMNYDDFHIGGKVSIAKAKLNLWKYSDFEETIYLDVDGLVMRELDFPIDYFCIQVNGYSDLQNDNTEANLWVIPSQVYDKYSIPLCNKLPGTNSSLMAWDQKGSEVFQKALEFLSDPIPVSNLRYQWGKTETDPDELYINSALAFIGFEPLPLKYVYTKKRRGEYTGFTEISKSYVLCCWGGLEFNHHEISGTGSIKSGLYNKLSREYFLKVYGEDLFYDHFFSLINNKIYAKGTKQLR